MTSESSGQRSCKTLIVGPAWVGDMVMAQSLFKALYGMGQQLTVLAPDWTRPLLKRMPEVSEAIPSPFEHGQLALMERRRFGRSLRQKGFDRAIILPNSFKSALIPWFASIPERVGWRGEWRDPILSDSRPLDKDSYPLMVQRFMALAYPPASRPDFLTLNPELVIDEEQRSATLQRYGISASDAVLAICPGAEFGEAKQWPAEHWAGLVSRATASGYQVWLFGSAKDRTIAEAISDRLSSQEKAQFRDLAGATSLDDAIDLLSKVQACISNDSGLMHVAAALSVPVVAIYGSTSPDFTPPLSSEVKLLFTDIACRPCFQRSCPLGHLRCLHDIEPDQVFTTVRRLLNKEPG